MSENEKSCIDCPDHKVIPDPDPHDWFCVDDEATVCTKTVNKDRNLGSPYMSDQSEFRVVSRGNRPYQTKKFSTVPEWCPKLRG